MESNLSRHEGITDFAGFSGSKSISDITTEAAIGSNIKQKQFPGRSPGGEIFRQGFVSLMHMMQNENVVEMMIKFNSFTSLYEVHDRSICFEVDD